MNADRWFSPREAALELGVGRRTIYNAIQSGELRAAFANGRDLRIRATWLRSWIDARAKARPRRHETRSAQVA
jgi:excisionase family DNA binding protein